MADQRWKQAGACRSIEDGGTLTIQESDAIFFLTPGKKANRAKAFCGACPVMRQCRDYALLYNENGIWGGQTDEERATLRPILIDMLENQAANRGQLESRNISDFIPTQRTPTADLVDLYETPAFRDAIERAEELLLELEVG